MNYNELSELTVHVCARWSAGLKNKLLSGWQSVADQPGKLLSLSEQTENEEA